MTDEQVVLRLTEAMREAFQQPKIDYVADQNLRDFFGFDSVQFVNLILMLEERLGVSFGEAEVDSIYVVGDIFRLLRGKLPGQTA
jgi:acyl carrier protein